MKTEKMKEEIKEMWGQLRNKTDFAIRVAPMVERSPGTVYKHWFGNSKMSPGLPDNRKTLIILRRELLKAPKKQS